MQRTYNKGKIARCFFFLLQNRVANLDLGLRICPYDPPHFGLYYAISRNLAGAELLFHKRCIFRSSTDNGKFLTSLHLLLLTNNRVLLEGKLIREKAN